MTRQDSFEAFKLNCDFGYNTGLWIRQNSILAFKNHNLDEHHDKHGRDQAIIPKETNASKNLSSYWVRIFHHYCLIQLRK